MLNIHTGSNKLLSGELCRTIRSAMSKDNIYVVVPRQLTLLTEQTIMHELNISSSFNIQVYNSTRICNLIFDEAGYPSGSHIDERGRVMLCRRAAHDVRESLTVYCDAEKRAGFAAKCAEQIEAFIQGGVTAENIEKTSENATGSDARKLHDLSVIMRRYTELTEGLYQDTETELIAATERAKNAPFLRSACFIFFGFSIVPPVLTNFVASVAGYADETHILLPLTGDEKAPDDDCYLPIKKTLRRLISACNEYKVSYRYVSVETEDNDNAISYYAKQLYSDKIQKYSGSTSSITAFSTHSIREECRYVAALARQLRREQNFRYSDMQIICTDIETYRSALKEAFEVYDVPLLAEGGRPVSRVGAAELLLFAIKTINDNYRLQDVIALIRTGYCGISRKNTDYLENYAVENGIEGLLWTKPFTRGKNEKALEYAENYRVKVIDPLRTLQKKLSSADDLNQQLTAIFNYLEQIKVKNSCQKAADYFSNKGLNEEAGLISQSWNRLISTLDMMNDLLGHEALSLVELYRTLAASLDVSMLKILPQSNDAVYTQSANSLLQQHTRVLFVMGLIEHTASKSSMLLLPSQQRLITEYTGKYVGPNEEDTPLQRRYYLKESIGMAIDRLYLSCSMVDFEGETSKLGREISCLKDIFEQKNVSDEEKSFNPAGLPNQVFPYMTAKDAENMKVALLGARESAFSYAASAYNSKDNKLGLSAMYALQEIAVSDSRTKKKLDALNALSCERTDKNSVSPDNAAALYQGIDSASITQLEQFSKCPFAHFMKYGLHPYIINPYEVSFSDSGEFLHGCINRFLEAYKGQLNEFSKEEAAAKMQILAEEFLNGDYQLKHPRIVYMMEDDPSVRQEYEDLIQRACHSAEIMAQHMDQSLFRVTETEMRFTKEDDPSSEAFAMNGSIDRVDLWSDGKRVRVIDFKSSDKKIDPSALLEGSSLQLPIYLGIAKEKMGADCAGMYYFPMLDSYISDSSRNPIELEHKREQEMRLSGLLPADQDVMHAQTPTPELVFADSKKSDAVATDADFERVIAHSHKKVQEHLTAIQQGSCASLPLKANGKLPCIYCEHHSACLFEPSKDKIRNLKHVTWEQYFSELVNENSDEHE